MENNTESLQKLGLNKAEAKTYLALLRLKESKTGVLCEKTNIPSSNIYSILESLMKKGFATYRIQNNVKVFLPSDPEILEEIFDDKQKEIEKERKEIKELIKNLKSEHNVPLALSGYKYFEGLQAVKSVWFELTEELEKIPKNETIVIYTGIKGAFEPMMPLYEEYHKRRLKNKINYKVIYPFGEEKLGSKRKKQLAEVKFLDLKNEAGWGVMGDKFFIQYITKKVPRGFLIKDKVFADTFKQVFEQIWKVAKK